MNDTTSLDTLQRENAELREENKALRSGLLKVARERAAESFGMNPGMERWIRGETVEEIEADAAKLAAKLGYQQHYQPVSVEARVLQQHFAEEAARAKSMAGIDDNEGGNAR